MDRHFYKDTHSINTLKRCSTNLLAISNMQLKTIRHYFIATRMAKTKKTITSASKDMEKTGTLIHCWWNCKWCNYFWKTIWQFLNILNIQLPCALTIPLLDISPKEIKTYGYTHMNIHSIIIHSIQKVMNSNTQKLING